MKITLLLEIKLDASEHETIYQGQLEDMVHSGIKQMKQKDERFPISNMDSLSCLNCQKNKKE